jgi:hypothetical protein
MNDDNSTIATRTTAPDLTSQEVEEKVVVENNEGKDLSNGLKRVSINGENKPDPLSEHGDQERVNPEEVKSRELPELKATHAGSNLRARRGIEVTIFAFLAVFGTLFALQKLGYEMELSVTNSQLMSKPKSLINIFYNDDAVERENVKEVPALEDTEIETEEAEVNSGEAIIEETETESVDEEEKETEYVKEEETATESVDEEETETEYVKEEAATESVDEEETETEYVNEETAETESVGGEPETSIDKTETETENDGTSEELNSDLVDPAVETKADQDDISSQEL